MVRYFANKFFYLLVSLFILITATFFLMKAIPGNPFLSEKAVSPEIREKLFHQYGLDKPVFVQYIDYLGKVIRGDLGISMKIINQDVTDRILQTFSASLRLGLVAIVASVIIGVLLGMLAALYHRKLIDNIAMVLAVLGIAVPSFVIAALLQFFLAFKLHLFNVAGLQSPLDFVLPVAALSAQPIAFIARLTRSSMLEVLNADYIKTAKAKGLNWVTIMFRHVIRNGILPVVTYMGTMTANIVTGSVVIEQVFGIGGIGKQFVQSIGDRDYPMIMGITIFYGALLMFTRFITDLLYPFIDPRIKLVKGKEG